MVSSLRYVEGGRKNNSKVRNELEMRYYNKTNWLGLACSNIGQCQLAGRDVSEMTYLQPVEQAIQHVANDSERSFESSYHGSA